jgi:hypothetical protein
MRVVAAVVSIITLFIVLYLFGAGQGIEACMDDCKNTHCMRYAIDRMNCPQQAEYEVCIDSCYEAHDPERSTAGNRRGPSRPR